MMVPTGWSPRTAGEQLIDDLLQSSGHRPHDVHSIVVTGYGRVAVMEASRTVTEIKCHARGEMCIRDSHNVPGNFDFCDGNAPI